MFRSQTSRSSPRTGESAVIRCSSSVEACRCGRRPRRRAGRPRGSRARCSSSSRARSCVDVTRSMCGEDRDVEHELAVLALADLEERPVVGGPDVVALGVHEQDVRRRVADLAAEDERRGAVGPDARRGARAPTSGSAGRRRAPPRTGARRWRGSRARRPSRGRRRSGRAPPGSWRGCRPTGGRRAGPAPAGRRGASGTC